MIFFSSDWHLGHERIIELSGRPFDTARQMNRWLIDQANRQAGPDDTIVFVGDMVMGTMAETLPLIEEIQAHKKLVPGNHDRVSSLYQQKPEKLAEWEMKYMAVGFQVTADLFGWEMGGRTFDVCHFPHAGDSHDEDRFAAARPPDSGRWLLHGHVHEAWRVRGKQINVGVDAWGGKLVPWDTLVGIAVDGPAMLDPLPWLV